jgi:sodium-dependent dicarboxylate transporter 2/3/5
MTALGMSRLGLLVFAIIWWTLAPVPLAVTTVAALGAGVLLGALTMTDAFAAPTHWVMWFVIGTFGLSAALEAPGLNRRFALTFLSAPITRGRPYAFLFMFLLSAAVMSTVISSTVVAVVWLSLATTIFAALRLQKGDPFAETTAIGLAWAANVGGIGTPVGTANNVVAIGLVAQGTGVTPTFLTWSLIGMVTALVIIAIVFLVIRYVMQPDLSHIGGDETPAFVEDGWQRLGPMTTSEKWAIFWVGLVLLLWVVPDVAHFVASPAAARFVDERMGLVVPALLVPVAMCLIPVGRERRPVLTWDIWARNVEWGMVLFIGGVLSIAAAVAAPQTGVPEALGRAFEPLLGGLPEYVVVLVLSMGVVAVTGVMSNLATITIFLPLALAVSTGLGIGHPVALGSVLGMGASLDYLLPSGAPTNAIVAGSGWMRVGVMLRYGLIIAFITGLVLTFLTYPLAKWLMS